MTGRAAIHREGHPATADPRAVPWKVLLYIPNLIGHIRLLLLIAFVVYDEYPSSGESNRDATRLFLLATSIGLDVVDGIAARRLNQCTQFGYLYDILLDCLAPMVVYGQCRQFVWKAIAGFFGLLCICWGFLTLASANNNISWKREDRQPRYWPACALVQVDGSFSHLGSLIWYLGYFGFLVLLCALDRHVIEVGWSSWSPLHFAVFTMALLNTACLLEYIHWYLESLLLEETAPSRKDKDHTH